MQAQQFLEAGGKRWRITKIPAWFAKSEAPDLMSCVGAWTGSEWVNLDSKELVDIHVPDWETLSTLEEASMKYNYGFLESWKPVRMPTSMKNARPSVTCKYMDSIFSALIVAGYATLHEMRTVYSLEDVFMMVEVLTVHNINEHTAMNKK